MTLEEAIKHEYKIADQLIADAMCIEEAYQTGEQKDKEVCAEKHKQVAEWLIQLYEIKQVFDEWDDFKIDGAMFCGKVVDILSRG